MAYYAYLVRCRDGSYYCGYTNDLKKRVGAHNEGRGGRYTRARLPVRLAYSEEFNTKSGAMKREHEIKRLTRSQKIALVKGIK